MNTYTVTPVSGVTVSSSCYGVRKWGRQVTMGIILSGVTVSTSWATVATIPAEIAPDIIVAGQGSLGTAGLGAGVRVNASGEIQIAGAAASNQTLRINMTWFV